MSPRSKKDQELISCIAFQNGTEDQYLLKRLGMSVALLHQSRLKAGHGDPTEAPFMASVAARFLADPINYEVQEVEVLRCNGAEVSLACGSTVSVASLSPAAALGILLNLTNKAEAAYAAADDAAARDYVEAAHLIGDTVITSRS